MDFIDRFRSFFKPSKPANPAITQINNLLERAIQAHNAENYDQALALYDEALPITEQTSVDLLRMDILLRRTHLLTLTGQHNEAETTLQQASQLPIAQDSPAAQSHIQIARGRLYDAAGDTLAAEEAYEQARSRARAAQAAAPQGRATVLLGDLALRENNASFAIHLLREGIPLIQAANDNDLLPFALGRLGVALIANGEAQRGRQVLNNAIETGMAQHQSAILRELNLEAGQYALNANENTLGLQYFSNALKLFPYPERNSDEHFETHLYAAFCALQIAKVEEAEAFIKTAHTLYASKITPEQASLLCGMEGLLAYNLYDNEKAEPLLRDALKEHDHTFPTQLRKEMWHALADVFKQLRRYEDALHTFEQILPRFPAPSDQTRALLGQASLLASQPNRRAATIETYQRILQIREQTGNTADMSFTTARIAEMEGQLGLGQRVMRRLEQALLMLNSSGGGLAAIGTQLTIARSYTDYGDLETALGLAESALKTMESLGQPTGSARYRMGVIMTLQGHAAEAIIQLNSARNDPDVQRRPEYRMKIVTHLGKAYTALGEHALAISHHHEALAMINQEEEPEHAAYATLNMADSHLAQGHTQEAVHHYEKALESAQHSDYHIQTWMITLRLAQALVPDDMERASQLLDAVKDKVVNSSARRLLVELYTLQSKLAAAQGDSDNANRHWQAATHQRTLAQLPAVTADWLS